MSEITAVVCPVNIMTAPKELFSRNEESQNNLEPPKKFSSPINIARIWAMFERRPDFTSGNQIRESVNSLTKAKLDHAGGDNVEIWRIAKRQVAIPPETDRQARGLIAAAHTEIELGLGKFKLKEGGHANE